MHHTLNTSLIYFNVYSIHSNFYQNIKNYSKIFFWIFLNFYSRLFDCHFIFSALHIVWRFVFCFRLEVWFQVEKRLPARWLNPTSWLSANLGTKVLGEQVYVSETKLAYALSPQCFHSLGGEPWCSCIIYILISFVAVILGSIHSQYKCLHSLRSCILRPIGHTSSASC